MSLLSRTVATNSRSTSAVVCLAKPDCLSYSVLENTDFSSVGRISNQLVLANDISHQQYSDAVGIRMYFVNLFITVGCIF